MEKTLDFLIRQSTLPHEACMTSLHSWRGTCQAGVLLEHLRSSRCRSNFLTRAFRVDKNVAKARLVVTYYIQWYIKEGPWAPLALQEKSTVMLLKSPLLNPMLRLLPLELRLYQQNAHVQSLRPSNDRIREFASSPRPTQPGT
jgi:hypothetical protein